MLATTLLYILIPTILFFLSAHYKKQYNETKNTLKQLSSLLDTINNAIDDNKLTQYEIKQIISQCKTLINNKRGKNARRKW